MESIHDKQWEMIQKLLACAGCCLGAGLNVKEIKHTWSACVMSACNLKLYIATMAYYRYNVSLSSGPVLRHLNESSVTSTEINL